MSREICDMKDCNNKLAVCKFCNGGDAYNCTTHSNTFMNVDNNTICNRCTNKYICKECMKNNIMSIVDRCTGHYQEYSQNCKKHSNEFKPLINGDPNKRYCNAILENNTCNECNRVGIVYKRCDGCNRRYCTNCNDHNNFVDVDISPCTLYPNRVCIAVASHTARCGRCMIGTSITEIQNAYRNQAQV